MEHYRVLFFIHNELLGEALREQEYVHGQPFPPRSRAWFCPACGEVWARAHVEGRRYQVWTQLCEKHPRLGGWMTDLPGSIWDHHDRDFTDSLPLAVMQREARLALAAVEAGKAVGWLLLTRGEAA